jgi:hypothetical protein
VKPNRRKIRREPARDVAPPEVPEVVSAPPAPSPARPETDPIPEHIRRMLEAAYT